MKAKIKAIAKGIALGAAAIAAASVLFGCTTIVEIDRRGAK